jgi:hypothetical protein
LARAGSPFRRSGAHAKGWITAGQADTWWGALEDNDRAGKFFCAMSGVMAAGTVE